MRLLAGVMLALLGTVAPSFGQTGFLDRSLTINGETFRYQIYIPIEWSSTRKWPVILSLHGNATQGTDGMRHTAASGLIREVRNNRHRVPAVIVFPQAREGTSWATARMQELALATVDDAVEHFNGDVDRLYLVGQSMGGRGVLRIASRWPQRFAALATSAAPVTMGQAATILDPGEDRRIHPHLNAADPFAALAVTIARVPIWMFHSSADETVPVEQARRLSAALKSVNPQARYTEYEGLDHTTTGQKYPTEPEFFSWLFSHRRPRIAD
jgi:predicted peptidase